ncbi:hypothetical protein D9C73_006217 [Collichthys lucidus]|uniref:Uncharacterized protein n=1 Tax=Collichthys lucidus TaxID=240159 RepID=A0A4U5UC77_COLLU|nr:hypothetical protein D9C73_006217 [Collichthys lucidus]
MSWTDKIRKHIEKITGRIERKRLRRQVMELRAELQTVNLDLTQAFTNLTSKEILNNELKEQLESVAKERFEDKERSLQQEKLYREEIAQHRFENMKLNDRNKKLQDELEHAQKEIKSMEDDHRIIAQLFEEVSKKYSAKQEKTSELEEALKEKDLELKSVSEKLEEVKQTSPSPGEDAEEQSSVSDEADVDRSTSASTIPAEDAEEQSPVSDDETFSEDTDTDDRQPLLPKPDFDQHQTFKKIIKRVQDFFGIGKRNKEQTRVRIHQL